MYREPLGVGVSGVADLMQKDDRITELCRDLHHAKERVAKLEGLLERYHDWHLKNAVSWRKRQKK